MCKKLIVLTLCALALSMMLTELARAGDPTLIGWWKLDDGQGGTALDLSDYEQHGQVANSVWLDDSERGMVISFNGTDGYVDPDLTIPAMTMDNGFTWIFWARQDGAQAINNDTILGNRNGGTGAPLQFIKFTPTRFEMYNDDGAYANGINYDPVPGDVWVHHALVKDGAELTYYRDGVVTHTNTMIKTVDENPFYMGADAFGAAQEAWQGYLSDLRLYTRALPEGEVLGVMAGKGPNAEQAGDPVPETETIDIPLDTVLSWTPGEYAATHDVYLGTVMDDVNNASRANPLGVLLSEGQADASYDPAGLLELGTTYYWRVDEVNGAPDNTIFKGELWTFTAEPLAYPIANITAVSEGAAGLEKTVDGSGLDDNDQHSTEATDMWLATPAAGETVQFQYEFDRVYKLHEMLVWNYNVQFELILGFGLKDVTVEYSTDGAEWTVLGDVQFAQATAKAGYTANTAVDFGGAAAQYVRLTVNSGYGMMGQFGLSEVRFMFIPAHAREPQPDNGAIDVSVVTDLTWRAGRDSISHDVYVGTDAEALALAGTVDTAGYSLDALDLDTMVYWRVDENQEAESWEGSLWSFTTQPYIVVDDFESYDDEDNRIYDAWVDGYGVSSNGSTVGHLESPFAEQTIVKNGSQSMPLFYDNAGTLMSEAELTLAQNWSASGIQSLTLSFHGDLANTGGQLYVKINGTKIPYDGSAVNLTKATWNLWSIDLSTAGNVSNVSSLTIGIEGAGASGVVYIDDVQLHPEVLAYHKFPDITAAGDIVQGVPNDDDWPAAESPDLAIDDDTATKYLHRKGGAMATGIQITPAAGSTVVTGLTLTTANDAPTRDPITFELSGSNGTIDGPYTLIAGGDVVDFAGAAEWPRFTKNETVITFDNDVAYTHYQIVFPTLRGESETLMQIAEIELIGSAP